MQICAVSSCRVGACEILHSYTTMGVVACVRTRAQLLTLLSCTYIPLTGLAQKAKTVDKGRMSITEDRGYYRPAFVVLDTTRFDQVGDFQMALRVCLDTIRMRLTIGDCVGDIVCRDYIHRNHHNVYPAPMPVSLPERVVAGSDLPDEGQTAGCDVREVKVYRVKRYAKSDRW